MKNSAEAMTNAGTKDPKISLSSLKSDEDLVLTVEDNGPGIEEEFLPHIFDNFSTSGKKDGTGLGLAIVKKIVEDHSGSIQIESVLQQGTKAEIKIPIRRPNK